MQDTSRIVRARPRPAENSFHGRNLGALRCFAKGFCYAECSTRGCGGRKVHGEDRALARLALDLEQAAMMADDVLDDGEAEPGAAELARARGVDAVKALGEAGNVLARDAAAVV